MENLLSFEEFVNTVDSFEYEITSYEELEDLNLADNVTEDEFFEKTFSLQYRKTTTDNWSEHFIISGNGNTDGCNINYSPFSDEDVYDLYVEHFESIIEIA